MIAARPSRTGHPRSTRPSPLRAVAWLLLVIAVTFGAAASVSAQAAPRIAYVDMKRLLDNAPQVAAGRERLAREFRERDAQLKQQEARLADLKRQQAAGAAAAAADVAQAAQLAREISTLERGIERLRGQLRSELGNRGAEELGRRWPEIQSVIVEYAREQKYDLVLQGPVLFAAASIDITDRVLERLRSVSRPPAPAPNVP